MRQALKAGGLLLLEGNTPKRLEYGTGDLSKVENLYTREVLEQPFGDFEDLSITEYEMKMSAGSRHAGMSALIDLLGRK